MTKILLAVMALCAGATPALAASAFSADPRIELLGVVQYLSGARPDLAADEEYRMDVAKGFKGFVGHPVIARWRENGEGWGIDMLCLSNPPELQPLPGCRTPHRLTAAEAGRWRSFLVTLRDFSRRSKFMSFYGDHHSDYKKICGLTATAIGTKDPLQAAEKYLGLELETDARWIVSPLFVAGPVNANIVPYPNPATLPDPGREKFAATTLIAYSPGPPTSDATLTQHSHGAAWRLPLIVFVEPAVAAFVASRSSVAVDARYKDALVAALTMRLEGVASAPAADNDGVVVALARRLQEYEANRQKWPTIWEFFPRLMAVFPEHVDAKADAPNQYPVKRVKDLFPARRAVRN